MNVIVIGGGAAGMMAAVTAASLGDSVTLIERNDKLGKKLYITGKGRCNITNSCARQEFLANVVNNSRFLTSALSRFSPDDTVQMCESMGCETKVERGNRVFPASDKSSDFIRVMSMQLRDCGVDIRLNARVKSLKIDTNYINADNCSDNTVSGGISNKKARVSGEASVASGAVAECKRISGVVLESGEELAADKVIIATGGMSYPGTGSTGDGYSLAKSVGHSIVTPIAALTPIDVSEDVAELAGVSLKNVNCKAIDASGAVICEEFGEMLFTHTGLSGPVILSISSRINRIVGKGAIYISIDLKPALDAEQLDARILRDFDAANNKALKNSLSELLISSLREPIVKLAGIAMDKRVNQISKSERLALVKTLKDFRFTVRKLGAIAGAIVTAGGVATHEINPKNMESRIVGGLHFAGEVIDVDALTGGYNIQIALSTGYLAGN